MRHDEVAAVTAVAEAGGPASAPLRKAVDGDPHSVRVVHIGHEVLGAFILHEMPGNIEEVSCITLNEEGARSGAEPLLLDYVVKAARFSRKKAVEVVTARGSPEEVHVRAAGFSVAGDTGEGSVRYRLQLRGK